LDRRIATSVARGEAAIARQEVATAQIKAISARMGGQLERAEEERVDLKALIREDRDDLKALIQEGRGDFEALIQEIRVGNREVITELRESRDERRAVLDGLKRVLDRLPPPKEAR
jgi:hypothetical protein